MIFAVSNSIDEKVVEKCSFALLEKKVKRSLNSKNLLKKCVTHKFGKNSVVDTFNIRVI